MRLAFCGDNRTRTTKLMSRGGHRPNLSSPPYGGDEVLSVGNLAEQPNTFSVGG